MLKHRAKTILGNVPADWEARPLRSLLTGELGGDWGDEQGEQSLKVIRSTNFTDTGYLDFSDVEQRCFTTEKAGKFQPTKGDILVERSGGGPTQPVGRIGIIEHDLPGHGFSNFVQLLRPNQQEIVPDFLAWSLFRLHQSGIVERLQHQTTQMRNLDYRDYVRVLMPRPPRPEQEAIAKAIRLVSETIRLAGDKLKAAQRLKTALMQQLFTRGIPGRHTTFKQTKIGEIPEQWDVISLGNIADIDAGVALNPEREPRNNGYRYLTVVNVQREHIDLSEVRHLELWDSEIPGKLLKAGDIVAVEGHANSSEIGRAAMVTAEADGMAFQNHLFRVRLRPEVDFNSRFLLGCMNSERVRRHWNATANTSSGLNTINRRGLRKLLVPQPHKDEQDDIVALITSANANIQATENELNAVRRLKTSLLQNLLTGKVRVKMET